MSPLFNTIAEIKAFLTGVALSDTDLEVRVDEVDQFITSRAGPHCVADNDTLTADAQYRKGVYLPRGSRQVVSVAKIDEIGVAATALNATNYGTITDGHWLLIKTSQGIGFDDRIRVVYRPVRDLDERRGVLIDLLKNRLAYDGQNSLSVGGVAASWSPHDMQIVARVVPQGVPVG